MPVDPKLKILKDTNSIMIPIWATLHINKNFTGNDGKVNGIGLKAILMKGNEEYE